MPSVRLTDLRKLLDYVEESEAAHFAEYECEPESHIYTQIRRLRKWMNSSETGASVKTLPAFSHSFRDVLALVDTRHGANTIGDWSPAERKVVCTYVNSGVGAVDELLGRMGLEPNAWSNAERREIYHALWDKPKP
jgi:hypothetical protein